MRPTLAHLPRKNSRSSSSFRRSDSQKRPRLFEHAFFQLETVLRPFATPIPGPSIPFSPLCLYPIHILAVQSCPALLSVVAALHASFPRLTKFADTFPRTSAAARSVPRPSSCRVAVGKSPLCTPLASPLLCSRSVRRSHLPTPRYPDSSLSTPASHACCALGSACTSGVSGR